MQLCDDGHDEVCYESRNCPVCDLRDDLEATIKELEDEIGKLEAEE